MGRPADYPLSGTLGQWLPSPCNGGPNKRAATPEPTKRQRGRLGPQAGMPILTKRYYQTSVGIAHKGGGPKTPMCEGEGTQGPWRRGATAGCRLSRQLLARYGWVVWSSCRVDGQRLLQGLSLLIQLILYWLSNARISEQQCCMEEVLNSQSCACRELTERVIIAIVTRQHMCAHNFVLCRLGGLSCLQQHAADVDIEGSGR